MSDTGFLLTRQAKDRSTLVNKKVLSTLPAAEWKRRRVNGGGGSSSGGGGGTGGSGCCCAEGYCIHIDGIADDELTSEYYSFPDPNFCGCSGGNEAQEIRLYKVDGGAWESKHGEGDVDQMMCSYPNCSATTIWEWNGASWDPVSTSGASCGSPAVPDFDGTAVGQSAQTTFTPEPKVGYWKRAGESLQFLIDENPVAEYALDSVRGGFCQNCTNTFRLTTCTRVKCNFIPPAVICLIPRLPGQTLTCPDQWEAQLPPALIATMTSQECQCPPASVVLWLQPVESLGGGETAVWQSNFFALGNCEDPIPSGGLWYLRFVLLGGFGCAHGTQIEWRVDTTAYCGHPSSVFVYTPGSTVASPEDLPTMTGTIRLSGFSGVPSGCGGLTLLFPLCGGGDLPDHYIEAVVTLPE